ncbi:MAG: HD domain-containing protein [Candidatus Neomarinimicrobiota bacterium]
MTNIKTLIEDDKERFPLLKMAGELGDETDTDAYVVGGYVRDLLMNRPLSDIDLMVVGDGIEFAREFAHRLGVRKIVPFKDFGTAEIPYDACRIEVASARKESYDPGSRKPRVTFTDLESDLLRRDFTINTMAISLGKKALGEVHDPLGGIKDLQKKIIRTPLDPDTTFSEDPLRLMRAIRFAAELEFQIDRAVVESMKRQVERIRIVSAERITAEFYRILQCVRPSIGLDLLEHVGLMKITFPEVSAMAGLEQPSEWHHKDIFYHTLQVVDNLAGMTEKGDLRFAGLVHDIGKPRTRKFDTEKRWTFHGHEVVGSRLIDTIAKRMKLSNKTKDYLKEMTFLHLRPIALAMEGVTDSAVRRVMVAAGDNVDDLMALCRADITSKNPRLVTKYLGNFDRVEKMMQDVQERDAMREFQSPVRGDVIMKECGIGPGLTVGKIKKDIEEAILDGDIENNYDAAYEYFLKIKDKYLARSI